MVWWSFCGGGVVLAVCFCGGAVVFLWRCGGDVLFRWW